MRRIVYSFYAGSIPVFGAKFLLRTVLQVGFEAKRRQVRFLSRAPNIGCFQQTLNFKTIIFEKKKHPDLFASVVERYTRWS